VLIKYDPRNLSRVFYRDKDGQYWPIRYRNLGAPPISLWKQREAMKRLRTEGCRLVDERSIFETPLTQRKLANNGKFVICPLTNIHQPQVYSVVTSTIASAIQQSSFRARLNRREISFAFYFALIGATGNGHHCRPIPWRASAPSVP
jgi:hypothetical protein